MAHRRQSSNAARSTSGLSGSYNNDTNPAYVNDPHRKRQKQDIDDINKKIDEEVWDLSDTDIIGMVHVDFRHNRMLISVAAAQRHQQSPVYKHYDMTIVWMETNGKRTIDYLFSYCFKDPKHNSFCRPRSAPSNISNMIITSNTCIIRDPARNTTSQHARAVPEFASTYTPTLHCTLLALRCAVEKRSYNSVNDVWYKAEVNMWRAGTPIPSADTVSKDVRWLYVGYALLMRAYFKVCPCFSRARADMMVAQFKGEKRLNKFIRNWQHQIALEKRRRLHLLLSQ